jgi:hypothetical protein
MGAVMVSKKSVLFSGCGVGLVLVFAAGAAPAGAASSDGTQFTETSTCVTDEVSGWTFCQTGSERHIEVRTPSGVAVFQGSGQVSATQVSPDGETTTVDNTHTFVSVFSYYESPWSFDPNVIKTDATSVYTFPGGATCTIVSDSISVLEDSRYNRDTVTCSP